MKVNFNTSRRNWVKHSAFGLLGLSAPSLILARDFHRLNPNVPENEVPDNRYPAIPLDIVAEVVGVSHFNLERLREIVDPRPELAKATWDWGFGDWESALGAASHVGRKDIAEYLIQNGATPSIFTYAMLGSYPAVKSMIEAYPGIQRQSGPHGFSLLHHARLALEMETTSRDEATALIAYLETFGDADGPEYLPMDESEKEKYLGDYVYGEDAQDGFSVMLNMRKLLSLGKPGKFGGALYKTGEHQFTYNGAPSVRVSFAVMNDRVTSLTIHEPGLVLQARKIN